MPNSLETGNLFLYWLKQNEIAQAALTPFPRATMFCSQLPLSQAKRGSGSNLPVINDQITTTDSEGVSDQNLTDISD